MKGEMMKTRISDDLVKEIIAKNNIVEVISEYLPLTKKGNNYWGLCPFHQDSSPSFSVSSNKNIYSCFSCNVSGNALTFLMKKNGWNFYQALDNLAKKINIDLDISNYQVNKNYTDTSLRLIEILDLANSFFKLEITKNSNPKVTQYISSRGLDDLEIRDKFDIGFATTKETLDYFNSLNINEIDLELSGLLNQNKKLIYSQRLTFGIRNQFGDIVGFSARTIDPNDSIKYINTPETIIFNKSKILYNWHNAKPAITTQKEIIIVEGFMDVIACYKANIHNVVALMGVALTVDHLRLISKYKVKLFLDNDQAGINAIIKSIKFLQKNNVAVEVIKNPLLKDPDEILKQYGASALKELVDRNSVSVVDFIYNALIKVHNLHTDVNFGKIDQFAKQLFDTLEFASVQEINYIKNKLNKDYGYQTETNEPKQYNQTRFNNNFSDFELTNFDINQNNQVILPKHNLSHKNKNDLLKIIASNTRIKLLVLTLANPNIHQAFFKHDETEEFYKIRYPELHQLYFEVKNFDLHTLFNEQLIQVLKQKEITNELKAQADSYFDNLSNQIKNDLNFIENNNKNDILNIINNVKLNLRNNVLEILHNVDQQYLNKIDLTIIDYIIDLLKQSFKSDSGSILIAPIIKQEIDDNQYLIKQNKKNNTPVFLHLEEHREKLMKISQSKFKKITW
ncbi:DNA primase [Mycoplasma sp. NEAQ87857]|uniref:DNA primase n=1 Tax=Mycoplasma sp. NEAQ87857 TaxID=2683967 RepID=UPI001319B363|nr:DNA primase [Mycoplasma sp. NEAQ87857]QGZ97473.1 DNA primase [Mycoplasma sp. NEAQ87857]